MTGSWGTAHEMRALEFAYSHYARGCDWIIVDGVKYFVEREGGVTSLYRSEPNGSKGDLTAFIGDDDFPRNHR